MRQLVSAAVLLLAACSGGERTAREPSSSLAGAELPKADGHLFTRLPPGYTGVRFENRLTSTQSLNVFTYRNFYNGGGVATGDLTGDGLPEIVLTANQGGPHLYLNLGRFRFRDITKDAGIATRPGSWTTGVTMADVNGDGLLDIYICHAGNGPPEQRANELYVNQGVGADSIPHFREMAREYGIADEGYTTQAAFFDYDRDGKPDLFVLNTSPRSVSSSAMQANDRTVRDKFGGHKLYHNVGGRCVDVTHAAGIYEPEFAFGLGVVVSDLNGDGWPDLYVANDFFEKDYLYLNNHNGTFTESIDREMSSISYSSMGMDIADVDTDGRPDVYTTDMLPEDEYRFKLTTVFESWSQAAANAQNGYHHQFTRNMLQINNGNGTYTEIGQMAGVARTDWSWGALIADFDLDSRKDIFVTNGIARDVTSQDYLQYLVSQRTQQQVARGQSVDFLRLVNAMTSTKLPNYAFHNNGSDSFTNASTAWGLNTPGFSAGAAYADLDGDGALDLVVNNVDDTAFVYRNNARAQLPNRYLQVTLDGYGGNRFALGAKVTVYDGARKLFQELSATRGFQSSVDYLLTFGLGRPARDTVDSVVVEWPASDGRVSARANVAVNQRLTMRQSESVKPRIPEALRAAPPPMLIDVTDSVAPPFVHHENDFVDFDREPLMPKLLSTEGPAMAVADVNGDGLDDVFIGGAKGQAGKLLIQRRDGRFESTSDREFEKDIISEDVGAAFFDANGDGRPDLYVVSGGNEYSEGASGLQDRLYLNDGHGRFHKTEGYVPAEALSGSRVAAADFDGDGDVDLFVGGRVIPWRYGLDPSSMLLRNDGTGHFTDVTDKLAPELRHVGMVTDAVWRDMDGDGRPDLIVVGEWMPITLFHNAGSGRLVRVDARHLEMSNGWWNRIVAGDFSGDGRTDFVVGNLGLNSRLRASDKQPLTMYVKDFTGTGFVRQVVCNDNNGVSYPIALRDELVAAVPSLQARFATYAAYARQGCADLFSSSELAGAVVKKAYTLGSAFVRNNGDDSFTLVELPREAQVAPVYGILASDVNGDGKTDLLLAGNFDGVKPEIGRMSASYGLLLLGDGKGGFRPVSGLESGFVVPGQTRDIQRVRTARGNLYIVARNNDRPLVFRARHAPIVAPGSRRSEIAAPGSRINKKNPD